jgi:Ca2+-binding EF-hand superfamily protein
MSLSPLNRVSLFTTRRGGIGKGCLIATGVVLAILVALGVWVALSWKGWAASAMRQGTNAMVQSSGLPQEERTAILSRVDAITKDFEDGKISSEQFGNVLKALGESPIMALGAVYGIDKAHIEKSGLTKEEKDAGRMELQRFARGCRDGAIKANELQAVIDTISEPDPFGNKKVKNKLTDAELKGLFAKAKETSDAAKVSNEPFTIDLVYEIDKVIAKGLGRPEPAPPGGTQGLQSPSSPAPAPAPAPGTGTGTGTKPEPTPANGGDKK